jgi:hypothetical protein
VARQGDVKNTTLPRRAAAQIMGAAWQTEPGPPTAHMPMAQFPDREFLLNREREAESLMTAAVRTTQHSRRTSS